MQQTTFWRFLQNQNIEIPIIQRDYAQGRIGKEKLREKFLTDLKNALDKGEVLKLDFVYGSIEHERLNLLDGQQRLTTLWLLHWYISFKAGELSKNINVFQNFTYETRSSSREFCKEISEFDLISESSVVEHIQNQTWFYSTWKQDPTIQAMFNMLGGTPIKDSKNNEIIDGIEEVFKDCNYLNYWEKLTSDNCPIVFYYLDLVGLALSDDLYIKMNARGKSLTSFENFKADLVGYVKENEIDKDKQPQETISHKFDTDWTYIFWKNKSEEHKIDEIYFAFLNRFILNSLITFKKPDGNDLYTQKEIESNNLFKYLYGDSGNDSILKYNSFDIYDSENVEFKNKLLKRVNITLDNFFLAFKILSKNDINNLFLPQWDSNSNFRFIPEYIDNPNANEESNEPKYIPTNLSQPYRVVFYAVCSYFENYQYDETAFKQWMRIVWNIVENSSIETIPSMIGAMRLIDEIIKGADNIYSYLANPLTHIKSEAAKAQITEEIEKAKQIANDITNTWECKIIEAEKTAFFKGAIRFLFRTGDNEYNWDVFEKRFEKTKLYFNNNGLNTFYKNDSILLRYLISWFDKWDYFHPEDTYKISLYYDNEISNWMTVLTHYAYIIPVNKLFDHEISELDYQSFESAMTGKIKSFHEDIVRSSILAKIVSGCTFHWWNYGGYYSLYPYNTKSQSKIYVLADERNEILSKLQKDNIIEVDNWQKITGIHYFKGWEIHFTTLRNDKKYQWWYCLKELIDNEWKDIPNVDLNNLETYLKEIKE